jgi:hypothetical protein
MGSSILSEVDEHLDSQDGALHPLLASFRLVKGLSALAPAQRAERSDFVQLAHHVDPAVQRTLRDRRSSGHAAEFVDPPPLTHSGHSPGSGVASLVVTTLLAVPVGALQSHPNAQAASLKTVSRRDRGPSAVSGAGLLSRVP